ASESRRVDRGVAGAHVGGEEDLLPVRGPDRRADAVGLDERHHLALQVGNANLRTPRRNLDTKRDSVASRGNARDVDARTGNPDDEPADGVFEPLFTRVLTNHG